MTSESKISAPEETVQPEKQEKPASTVLKGLMADLAKSIPGPTQGEEKIQKCLAVMSAVLSDKAVCSSTMEPKNEH